MSGLLAYGDEQILQGLSTSCNTKDWGKPAGSGRYHQRHCVQDGLLPFDRAGAIRSPTQAKGQSMQTETRPKVSWLSQFDTCEHDLMLQHRLTWSLALVASGVMPDRQRLNGYSFL